MLLEYSKEMREIWCHIPPTETRYSRLGAVCKTVSEKLGMPGLFSIVNHYDVLGHPYGVFTDAALSPSLNPTHSLCNIAMYLPAIRKKTKSSEDMGYITEFIRGMESTYGSAWIVDIIGRTDSIYVKIGFNDAGLSDPRVLDSDRTLPGNDIKFLCDCGQFKSERGFVSECDFAVNPNGVVGCGFYYNDSRRGCSDYISLGNGKFFKNMGYVDRGYVSDRHSGYSYYVRARNIDEGKITVIPYRGCPEDEKFSPDHAFGSVEEFALFREASGGLRIGDACYVYRVIVDPDGERRSTSSIICWDGSKWVDFYNETEVKDWPVLSQGWKLS